MNACQVRVITNGYLVVYMGEGGGLTEVCFTERADFLKYMDEVLETAAWEEE